MHSYIPYCLAITLLRFLNFPQKTRNRKSNFSFSFKAVVLVFTWDCLQRFEFRNSSIHLFESHSFIYFSQIVKVFTGLFSKIYKFGGKKICEESGTMALKSIHSVFLHKYLVFLNLQLMSALASLERFSEEYLFFINWRLWRHCLQNQWLLVNLIVSKTIYTCVGKLMNFRASYWHQLDKILENEQYEYL